MSIFSKMRAPPMAETELEEAKLALLSAAKLALLSAATSLEYAEAILAYQTARVERLTAYVSEQKAARLAESIPKRPPA